MRDFTVRGYLINIDGNRLHIKVSDEYIEKIAFIKSFHYKKSQLGNFMTINIKNAEFNIKNLKWSELKDLIGIELEYKCSTIIYEFQKKLVQPDSLKLDSDSYIPDYIKNRLISFSASSVKNV